MIMECATGMPMNINTRKSSNKTVPLSMDGSSAAQANGLSGRS